MNPVDTDLKNLRDKIDVIDEQIVTLLAARFDITRQVGKLKAQQNLPVESRGREALQFEQFSRLALAVGISENLIQNLYHLIIDEVKREHNAIRSE